MTLSALAKQLSGELTGNDCEFSQLTTDTRALLPGDLYLALQGERFDGNDFVQQAQELGACGAIVSRITACDLPQLRVHDTHEALGSIAASNRARSKARVVALTGSQGKTSVKEMIGSMLSKQATTLITEANLNNTIGVPLTLLKLAVEHEFAVIEMGANRAGEIEFSARIAQPDVALITNASAAHIEGFGSLEGIVAAKGEIIDGLRDDGTLVLNADDAHYQNWKRRAGAKRTVCFSQENRLGKAQYFASDIVIDANGKTGYLLVTPQGERRISMNVLGKHNITNGVAAAAAAMEAGASLDNVATGLCTVAPMKGRLLALPGLNGCRLIDDTYNASPGSFLAAIDVLMCHAGTKYLIAGDMRELGSEAEAAHSKVGAYAASAGVDYLLASGELSKITVEAFGDRARYFESQAELIAECKRLAAPGDVFLIKGSRGSRMETVVTALLLSEEM